MPIDLSRSAVRDTEYFRLVSKRVTEDSHLCDVCLQIKVLTRVKKDVCFPPLAKFCVPLPLYEMLFRKGIVLWV